MRRGHPRNPSRDYREPVAYELDQSLWEDGGHVTKETLMYFFGLYAFRTSNIKSISNWKEDVDSIHSYDQNSYGYRDIEYSDAPELIAAGCSQTFGQGVHEEGRWSTMLGEQLGLKTATIAVPGWGTQTAISAVMHHIKTYGKPKAVALLLPDFSRFDTILNTNYTTDTKHKHDPDYPVQPCHVNRSISNGHTPKFEKRPFPIDKVLNAEASYFGAGQALAHFIQYCEEAEIALVWATWDFRLDYFVRYIRDLTLTDSDKQGMSDLGISEKHLPYMDFTGYVDMEFFYLEDGRVEEFKNMTCHGNLRDKFGTCCFDLGTDKQEHMGVHMHAHVSDKFYETLTRKLE
jgi:hypothetical protein